MVNPILQSSISVSSDIPLYYQLISIIKRNISVGLLKPGDLLPSETEFCETFNISRTTVRQAIGELEEEGLVIRRRGKGTYISEPKLKRKMEDVYSFSNEMKNLGLRPDSKVIEFLGILPQADLVENLELKNKNSRVYKIVRLRRANEEPLLLETTYIPVYVYPGLTEEMLKGESLYSLLREKAGIVPFEAEESYESIILDREVSKMLHCKSNSSGFYIERKAKTQTGEVYEFTQSIMRGDRTKFVVNLKNNGITFNRNINLEELESSE